MVDCCGLRVPVQLMVLLVTPLTLQLIFAEDKELVPQFLILTFTGTRFPSQTVSGRIIPEIPISFDTADKVNSSAPMSGLSGFLLSPSKSVNRESFSPAPSIKALLI